MKKESVITEKNISRCIELIVPNKETICGNLIDYYYRNSGYKHTEEENNDNEDLSQDDDSLHSRVTSFYQKLEKNISINDFARLNSLNIKEEILSSILFEIINLAYSKFLFINTECNIKKKFCTFEEIFFLSKIKKSYESVDHVLHVDLANYSFIGNLSNIDSFVSLIITWRTFFLFYFLHKGKNHDPNKEYISFVNIGCPGVECSIKTFKDIKDTIEKIKTVEKNCINPFLLNIYYLLHDRDNKDIVCIRTFNKFKSSYYYDSRSSLDVSPSNEKDKIISHIYNGIVYLKHGYFNIFKLKNKLDKDYSMVLELANDIYTSDYFNLKTPKGRVIFLFKDKSLLLIINLFALTEFILKAIEEHLNIDSLKDKKLKATRVLKILEKNDRVLKKIKVFIPYESVSVFRNVPVLNSKVTHSLIY